jgi:hypothetical protein
MLSSVLPTELLELVFYWFLRDFTFDKIHQMYNWNSSEFILCNLIKVAKKKRLDELHAGMTKLPKIDNSFESYYVKWTEVGITMSITFEISMYEHLQYISLYYHHINNGVVDDDYHKVFRLNHKRSMVDYHSLNYDNGVSLTKICDIIYLDQWLNGKCSTGLPGHETICKTFAGITLCKQVVLSTMSYEELLAHSNIHIDNATYMLGVELPKLFLHAFEVNICIMEL